MHRRAASCLPDLVERLKVAQLKSRGVSAKNFGRVTQVARRIALALRRNNLQSQRFISALQPDKKLTPSKRRPPLLSPHVQPPPLRP